MENKHQKMTIKETNKIMQFLQGIFEGILVTAVLIHLVVWLVLGKTVNIFSSDFYPTLFIALYFLMKVNKSNREN
ncbi:TPA: hypothetical protein U2B86_001674 [Streptococcus suis]|uniref:hypothetical protein n=1 Tax=Streptococcus suis TaxID=1307 RepID=UPI000CF58D19|nr:hypothetical protein [Streptococcus suis]HEL1551080.1 hypothetical protein [Streptococcus suis]HEL2321607.1 hypothetical protein [Streptococcus suis]HEM6085535.1 hypothetical protein [Streptococcus suis]HEM6095856.1 hypothetical protein [Streptococcus suis]